MPRRSDQDPPQDWDALREKILGLGERSHRKSYYPELQRRLHDLERFRVLLDHASDGIYLVEMPEGVIRDVNETAATLVGRSREELLGVRLRELFPAQAWEGVVAAHGSRAGGARQTVVETRLASESEAVRPVELTVGSAVIDETSYAVLTARDVTERVRMQEELRQAQKMESIGRLAGGVAHDFNNLLTAIRGYADLVLAEISTGDPLHEDVAEIVRTTDRASEMTRQLLAFSRRQVLHPKVLDVNAVIHDMERMLRRLIGEDVRLTTCLAEDAGAIYADRGQIEQVLMNLSINARDAMPEGGSLTVETTHLVPCCRERAGGCGRRPEACVRIAVEDTGCGMDETVRARVFEPFFTTKGKGQGTGLGLATVYGIVSQSGGNVRLDSKPGYGTRFEICLPAVDAPVEASAREAEPVAAADGLETVLVVEDEPALRALVARVLRSRGYTVLEAVDAAEAERLCEEHGRAIDLLLTDVVMPGTSGPALAERLEARCPDLVTLFMSGYSPEALGRRRLMESGTALVKKPFTGGEIAERVRQRLDEVTRARETARRGTSEAAGSGGARPDRPPRR